MLLDGKATDGQLMIGRFDVAEGEAPPHHKHLNEDEVFLLIAGTALVWCDEQEYELSEGGIVHLPKNIAHGYRITSKRANLLMINTPAGIEGMFRETGRDKSAPRPADFRGRHGVGTFSRLPSHYAAIAKSRRITSQRSSPSQPRSSIASDSRTYPQRRWLALHHKTVKTPRSMYVRCYVLQMRLLLRYRTGDTSFPYGDVPTEQVREILAALGWLAKESQFTKEKLEEVVNLMPDSIRDEIRTGEPVLFTPRPGQWGIVSSEVSNQLFIRLINHDLDTLRDVADTVVAEFPAAFDKACGRDLGFVSEVAIRRFDSEIRIVVGQIEEAHNYGFWKYARKNKRREYFLALILTGLTVALIGGSAAIFLTSSSVALDYWRGYLDRGGTTFLTAALTMLLGVYFEYFNWRNQNRRVRWGESG